MKRTLDLSYDEVVIGSDLSALLYSYANKCPIIYLRKQIPDEFSELKDGSKSQDLWRRIMFSLSINNLSPFPDILQSIRFQDCNNIRLITKENFVCNINFKKCIVSDDYELSGLEYSEIQKCRNYLIIDKFIVKKKDPSFEEICFEQKFVNKIKINEYRKYKEICTFSYLNNEEINNGDYSEIISKIITFRNLSDIFRYEIKSSKRETIPLEKNLYSGLPENILFLYDEPDNLICLPKKENEYIDYTERIFL